jgi:Transmembrane secretion effector
MSPLAPFRHRAFFWLWLGVVIASVGTWAQMVGAQWLFVHDPNAATIVTLVQTASTLPMMLLALPAGVLADAFDRRWLMFGVQIYFIVVAALLAGLTAAGLMPPALLLTFTFAVGAGQAMLSPTWQALITELVPRNEFAAATRLDMQLSFRGTQGASRPGGYGQQTLLGRVRSSGPAVTLRDRQPGCGFECRCTPGRLPQVSRRSSSGRRRSRSRDTGRRLLPAWRLRR